MERTDDPTAETELARWWVLVLAFAPLLGLLWVLCGRLAWYLWR